MPLNKIPLIAPSASLALRAGALLTVLLCPAAAAAPDAAPNIALDTAPNIAPTPNVTPNTDLQADLARYRLGVGDLVRIQVHDEQDLNLEAKVGDTGVISYPFLGEIKAQGMTSAQLADYISERLRGDYLINPEVSVDILEYRPFYVNGEVQKPGSFPFRPGITVRKAISVAGGFKERASKRRIFLRKEGREQDQPVRVGLDNAVSPGDIITVEESFF